MEETLRWLSPVVNLPFRYTSEPVELAGTAIAAGEALLMCHAAAGRDPEQHGPDVHLFDATRTQRPHLAFGQGPHFCLGASLARLEGTLALERLFTRFPGLTLREANPQPLSSLISGGFTTLHATTANGPATA
ncbi:cytochrome P450 [Sinosporangium siamense]|uniref:cytochrome P450 n=1 Tax=Sinosporangium siamense TaxID=1367973 RepID=UPI001EF30950|nr:cytochrome P450 [Sinosporangium siamense]